MTIFPHIISGSSTCCDSINIIQSDAKAHINPSLFGVYNFDGNDPDGKRIYRKKFVDNTPRYISRSLILNTWQVW